VPHVNALREVRSIWCFGATGVLGVSVHHGPFEAAREPGSDGRYDIEGMDAFLHVSNTYELAGLGPLADPRVCLLIGLFVLYLRRVPDPGRSTLFTCVGESGSDARRLDLPPRGRTTVLIMKSVILPPQCGPTQTRAEHGSFVRSRLPVDAIYAR
jgi:hypothetical protein